MYYCVYIHFHSLSLSLSLCLPPPSSIEDRLQELEYRRVRLHGYFDHSRELHMWPRTLHSEGSFSGGFGKQGSEPGAQVVTAFYCQELG